MLRNIEPTTLVIKDYYTKKEAARKRSLALLNRFLLLNKFIKNANPEIEEKQRLFVELGFDEQYKEWANQIIQRDSRCVGGPYRSSSHPPIPSLEEVVSRCDIKDLKEAKLFYKPVLYIQASGKGSVWEIGICDDISLKSAISENQSSDGNGFDLERYVQRMAKIRNILDGIRDSLYPLFYIFH